MADPSGDEERGYAARAPRPMDIERRADPERRTSYLDRRRERVVAEIQRNRRGEYVVPTWVLVVALVAVVASLAALVMLT